jgi:Na+/melibiose symporter-like transporter
MDPRIVAGIIVSLITFALTAVLFAALALQVGRRWGVQAIAIAWLVLTVIFTGLTALRVREMPRTVAGAQVEAPATAPRFPGFATFFPFWALGLGVVARIVRRRIVAGQVTFTRALALRSAGGFLAGGLLAFAIYAVIDISQRRGL